jgi:arylsulfatase A-like enzyme
MLGETLVPLLAAERDRAHDEAHVTILLQGQRTFVRQGRWKLSNLDGPFEESKMELFDVVADPGETRNLASTEPARYADMLQLWRDQRKALGILLPDGR